MLQSSKHILVRFNIVVLDGGIVPGRQTHSCVVLDCLPSPVSLGMPFLADMNPTIGWFAKSMMFGD